MATFYVQTTGSATNSGSTDTNSATVSGSAVTGLTTTTLTLDAGTDLSAVVTTAGPTQSTIYVNNATNSNVKIFKISAVSGSGGATPQVTVTVAPTGSDGGTWAIGGRLVWTPANIEAALAAGDIVVVNDSIAARATTYLTCRASGDGTSGQITFMGKAGVYPTLNVTSTPNVITTNSQNNWLIQGFTLDQDGGSGDVIAIGSATGWVVRDNKIIDGGANGISGSSCFTAIGNEISGVLSHGISVTGGNGCNLIGNYCHACGADGIRYAGTASLAVLNNILAANTGRGMYFSGAYTSQLSVTLFCGNTVYGNGDSGLEITDADINLVWINNIFSENGNAAGEYNVEWAAGNAQNYGYHGYNVFYSTGGGGSGNLSGVTANATESTADPQMVNPGSGNFNIVAASPASNAGIPGTFASGLVAYRDEGAMQRQVSASSGGGNPIIGG